MYNVERYTSRGLQTAAGYLMMYIRDTAAFVGPK